jgi:5-(carboxyamino)imidazole ribonucleotide mutase
MVKSRSLQEKGDGMTNQPDGASRLQFNAFAEPPEPSALPDSKTSTGSPAEALAPAAGAAQVNVQVGVLMGSSSDWETMRQAAQILAEFGVAHECKVVSAHRMPDEMFAYAEAAAGRGLVAIIAGAGGAAHLPGMLAAKTTVPVLGVPVASKHLSGVDSLHSIVQMPKGIPVATFAIGAAGAANAALFAVAMLATGNAALRTQLDAFRARQTAVAQAMTDDLK